MSRRAACARWLVPAVLTVGATACGAAGLQATPTPTETVTVLPNAPDESAAAMSRSDAAQVFLDAVCPSDYAFGVLENASIAAGGWEATEPGVARPYANRALKSVQNSAAALAQQVNWPADIAPDIAATSDEFLAMATPLQQVIDAQAGTEMGLAWDRLVNMPRVAEQRVRTNLGLGLAWTKKDGCPDPPKVTPQPQPQQTPSGDVASTTPIPVLTGPMVESTGDGLCHTPTWELPNLTGPDSDPGGTRMIQVMAVLYGFNPGAIDGQYGPNTIYAVKGLQNHLGVAADGQVGPSTWSALQYDYCGAPPS